MAKVSAGLPEMTLPWAQASVNIRIVALGRGRRVVVEADADRRHGVAAPDPGPSQISGRCDRSRPLPVEDQLRVGRVA
jgi:hypothetical protein